MVGENRTKFKLERQDWQLAVVLIVAMVLVLVGHLLTLETLHELEDANNEVVDIYEGNERLHNLETNLIALARTQEKFIQTANPAYARQAELAMQRMEQDLSKIHTFFKNEATRSSLNNLEQYVLQQIAFHRKINNVLRQNPEAVLTLDTDNDEGQRLQEAILPLISNLRSVHRQYMMRSINKKRALAYELKWGSFARVAFIVALALFALYYLVKTATQRRELMSSILEAKESAERASLFKEQFIANMSHEIRTPLNAIIGFSNLMGKTPLQGNQPEFLQSIRTSSENLLSIVNDILDFSKIEAGALRLEKVPFSLPTVIHSVEDMFRYREKENLLEFIVNIDPQLPEKIKGDPTRLTQVLVNLLGNAFKFTQQGKVKLNVTGEEKKEEWLLKIEVSDTGVGIPSNKLEHIFKRFEQASAETTRKFGGAGLGLTITRQLVELQNGNIRVESLENKGTTFFVQIPYDIAQNEEKKTVANREIATDFGDIHLLIVEDNPMNHRMLELLIDQWGISHDHAENGRIALEMLSQRDYDLILMDIQMPEMDGYTTTQKIRQELKLVTPIIATTAHVFAGERKKCLQYGMNDYISKPIDETELLRLIGQYTAFANEKSTMAEPSVSILDTDDASLQFDRHFVLNISREKPEVMQEMAAIFLQQSQRELEGIESALRQNDFKTAAAVAHSLKSTLAYMGFKEWATELIGKFEMEARQPKPSASQLTPLFQSLREKTLAARAFIEQQDWH